MSKGKKILLYSALFILATYFLFLGLAQAKGFLIPLTAAIILSLLMVPLSQKMEKRFMNRASASLVSTFIIFLVSVGFVALVSFQVKSIVDKWPDIKETMTPKIERLRSFVLEHTPVEKGDLEQSGESSSIPMMGSGSSSRGEQAANFFSQVMSFFADYLLTFIYIFFLLNYRHRFKEFLLKLFPDEKKKDVKTVIEKSASVTQHYLVGKLFLIGLLAVLYSVGLGISGVDNFILISVLAAVLSLVPYVGNIIGFGLALAFGYLTSGESGVLIGIIITFAIAQFVESYVLEPYVVGDQVDLHPFFVILAVIVGNMVWGVAGMILSIPILAMINVVLLNVGPLQAFGFLFSKEDSSD
ncbi:AI-2E family transporter [Salinimicrobium marinum]|uniref:AI-2E family transporter n=1 Tax=Salinimicrobium marinum TaxID=680283 RepID=A0A918SCB7_9FLAO|nr:AI-2E family transporter [Salinimicrobium marinum]GHA31576.1 AI-2E family transporter [Salinimicrobium marinum]